MNKKVICIVIAVLAFFGCSIWVSEVPVVSTLVTFLCTAAGFGCGYFFRKFQDAETIKKYETQYTDAAGELVHLQNEITKLKKNANTSAKASKKYATKVS